MRPFARRPRFNRKSEPGACLGIIPQCGDYPRQCRAALRRQRAAAVLADNGFRQRIALFIGHCFELSYTKTALTHKFEFAFHIFTPFLRQNSTTPAGRGQDGKEAIL